MKDYSIDIQPLSYTLGKCVCPAQAFVCRSQAHCLHTGLSILVLAVVLSRYLPFSDLPIYNEILADMEAGAPHPWSRLYCIMVTAHQ